MARKPHTYIVPSNYAQIKDLRAKEAIEIKNCPYIQDYVKLRKYQTIGCLNMAICTRMVLGDDPGLGKTLQTLAAYSIIKNHDPSMKLLVVTTKSSMRQWGSEVTKFLQGISHHVLEGDYKPKGAKKKLKGLDARKAQYKDHTETDILITGYYPLQVEYNLLSENRGDNYMVVYDECQAFKNANTQAFIGAEYVAERAKRVYGLSATPIKNKLIEFYNIFKVIVPGLFPNITAFKDEFTIQEFKMVPRKGGKPMMIKEVVDYKNLDQYRKIIDPYFLKRLADDVASDLPGIIAKLIQIEMTPAQKKLYKEALAGIVYQRKIQQRHFEIQEKLENDPNPSQKLIDMAEMLEEKYEEILSGDFLKNNKASALVYCQLVANGPGWIEEEGKSAKEEYFKDLLEGELYGNKVIVFTRFKSGITRLEKILDNLGVGHARVTGDEGDKEREEAMRAFQDKESNTQVIFITQAGSAAINLQTASVMMFYDTPWSFGDLVQTIGRARRIGSEHQNVMVYYMACLETIDYRVLDVQIAKQKLSDKIIGSQARGALEFDGYKSKLDEKSLSEKGEVDILFDEVFRV